MKKLIQSALCAACLAIGTQANATILTFDTDTTLPNSVLRMDQAYGDRVTATAMGIFGYGVGVEDFTANIVTEYFGGSNDGTASLTRWTSGYGDLVNVLENELDGDTLLALRFTADSGFAAQLFGFDLAGYPGIDYVIPGLSVVSNGITIFSQSNVLVQGDAVGPRRTSFVFNTPLSGSNLELRLDLTGLGASSDRIGLDNVRFGQMRQITGAVPELATWAMMILGFGAIGASLRRSKKPVAVSLSSLPRI